MNKILLTALMLALSATAQANIMGRDTAGFYLGAGGVAIQNDDCSSCDTEGFGLELGYDINSFIGLEFKYAETDFDNYPAYSLDFNYYGANIGYDFETPFFNIYAKVGLVDMVEEGPHNHYIDELNPAFGVGVRFTPFGDQDQFYIKLEGLVTDLAADEANSFRDDLSLGYLGVGYKF